MALFRQNDRSTWRTAREHFGKNERLLTVTPLPSSQCELFFVVKCLYDSSHLCITSQKWLTDRCVWLTRLRTASSFLLTISCIVVDSLRHYFTNTTITSVPLAVSLNSDHAQGGGIVFYSVYIVIVLQCKHTVLTSSILLPSSLYFTYVHHMYVRMFIL